MRFLNTTTLNLEHFPEYPPRYAILPHTWGNDQAAFDEVQSGIVLETTGYNKIVKSCAITKINGHAYIWIDTCCIDKKSISELFEAINSMYRFYANAEVCYTYLEDVSSIDSRAAFPKCKRLTRGWTLQELIAPSNVDFLSGHWSRFGTKNELAHALVQATGINKKILRDPNLLQEDSIAQRMAWASDRSTTREEDLAYCLLGIFGVNMPLLYGEGFKAFLRLQEEIIKESTDQSLFAWTPRDAFPKPFTFALSQTITRWCKPTKGAQKRRGAFARHPVEFALAAQFYMSQWKVFHHNQEGLVALLDCCDDGSLLTSLGFIGLRLDVVPEANAAIHARSVTSSIEVVRDNAKRWATRKSIFILKDGQ